MQCLDKSVCQMENCKWLDICLMFKLFTYDGPPLNYLEVGDMTKIFTTILVIFNQNLNHNISHFQLQ